MIDGIVGEVFHELVHVETAPGSADVPEEWRVGDFPTALLDESLRISTELGMRPLTERVLSKREILKA